MVARPPMHVSPRIQTIVIAGSIGAIILSAAVFWSDWRNAPPVPADRRIEDPATLSGRGFARGPATAAHTLVVFTDYTCTYCRSYAHLVDTLVAMKPEVRVVERHLPRTGSLLAWDAARAVECAGEQGRYAEMRQVLIRNALDRTAWGRLAAKAHVRDTVLLKRCMRQSFISERIAYDTAAARPLQPTGTPTVVLDEVRFAAPPVLTTILEKLQQQTSGG